MKNPLGTTGLFSTPEDIDALQDYVLQMSGSERVTAMTVMGMTWNLASKLVDAAIIESELNDEFDDDEDDFNDDNIQWNDDGSVTL